MVACRGTQAIVTLWGIATLFVTFLLCQPLAFNWDRAIPGGYCGDQLASWKSAGVVNILTDAVVLTLPVYDLSKIQMATYKKVVLIAMFALGIFTTAVGIARLVAIVDVDFGDITSGAT
ncbi:Uu.00g142290.m01.CDS01 [Anthostomella pinea]|uniref:Uu.00g142290.m01.CDS01 n=1 Tax=Anthostomella pinea TaxID=933095 RepID=A0AAI8VQF9_9PEZI|nr:Uu.00g142290.m01.CDS01 [Anthostomella pinea]